MQKNIHKFVICIFPKAISSNAKGHLYLVFVYYFIDLKLKQKGVSVHPVMLSYGDTSSR